MSASARPSRRPGSTSATAVPLWVRSPGFIAGVVAAVAIAAAGLIFSRVDIAVLALPLVVALGLSWGRLPSISEASTGRLVLGDPDATEIGYELEISAPAGVETIVVRYSHLAGAAHEFVVAGPITADLHGTVALLHSGRQEIARVEYRLLASDAMALTPSQPPLVAEHVVESDRSAIRALPLPRRLQGLTGSHESARAGDGGDFRDIHPFTVGDRLRRIDWKATARRGQNAADLYVRRTAALADATVLLVLDSRDDVGEQIAQWSLNAAAEKGTSSLDLAREAAGSIATAYVEAGDRVGFQDLSSTERMIPHGGGTRHLWRLLEAIDASEPSNAPVSHHRLPIVPSGALVYLLSSLLDRRAAGMALTWHSKGHRVIVVDVLPPPQFARASRYDRAAHRVLMMERDDRIRMLRTRGVELLRWSEDESLLPRHARLQLLSRPPRRGGSTMGVRR